MEWVLVYENQSYKIYKDKEGKLIKFVYLDGREVIKEYDWTQDDRGG